MSAINTPAIAAALVTKEFIARSPEQLTIRVGDIISIIEMCSRQQNDATWWKAKLTISAGRTILPTEDENSNAFKIGIFPSDCVQLFEDKGLPTSSYPPSSHKYSHFAAARRVSEMLKRGVRRRNLVFSVDLEQHLTRTERKIPLILEKCVAAIEKHGIVTGIYRQCGIQSNIQRLRAKFDSGCEPDLFEFAILRDIYSVSSLLKQYFRQLPNPLFTFQLYARLLEAYDSDTEVEKIRNLKGVLGMMPIGHYDTASFLLRHLNRLCEFTSLTDMTSRNLAIVWAPNLFRAPPTVTGTDSHLLNGLNIHTALCNFLIQHAKEIFREEDEGNDELHFVRSSVFPSSSSVVHRRHQSFNESINSTLPEDAKSKMSRKSSDFRWSRVFRGRSVDNFLSGFPGRKRTLNEARLKQTSNSIKEEKEDQKVKWRRSVSADVALRGTRSESILSMMSKGYEELRDGLRNWTKRAYSMRPGTRPPLSPILYRTSHERMQESVTASSISRISTSERIDRKEFTQLFLFMISFSDSLNNWREESPTTSCSGSFVLDRVVNERRVVFRSRVHEKEEGSILELPLCERSSPVEEWSSDSRNSLHLEVSRYDNVSPSRPREHVIDRSVTLPVMTESFSSSPHEYYDNHKFVLQKITSK